MILIYFNVWVYLLLLRIGNVQKGLFIEEKKNRGKNLISYNFSYFDELLTPFSPTYPTHHSSLPSTKRTRAHGRQSSFDAKSNRGYFTRVKR